MRIAPSVLGLHLLVAGAILAVDLLAPLGIAAPLAYVGLVLLSGRVPWPLYPWMLAGLASVLAVLGAVVSTAPGVAEAELANRALTLLMVWLTAGFCHRRIQGGQALEAAQSELRRQVERAAAQSAEAAAALRREHRARVRAEQDLQATEQRYLGVFHQTFQLVATLEPSGRVEEANETLLAAGSLRPDEVADRPVWDLPLWGEDSASRARLRAGVGEAGTGNFFRDEFVIVAPVGEPMTVDLSIKPVRDAAGRVAVLILEARDISEHKQNQEMLAQAQKSEALGQLTSGIAHDFNNLLTVISGNLELIERRIQDGGPLARRIEKALAAVLRGRALTEQLLAFARGQALSPQVVEVNELVRGMDELLSRSLEANVSIETELDPGLWPCRADPAQLQTALLNLVLNARDALPKGGGVVIRTANATLGGGSGRGRPNLPAGDYVVLSVSDEGEGIAPEILDKVTDPFFTTKPAGAGSGLGLSMVYGFIKQSGGDLEIASQPGAGTTVRLYLPRSAEPVHAAAPGSRAPPAANGRARVLVVEDQADVREVAVSILSDLGYAVDEAEDGAAALGLLNEGRAYDLLLTDLMMPGPHDGREVARRARGVLPKLKVLYSSGSAERHAAPGHSAPEAGAFIAKPFRYADLARKVADVLGRET